MTEFEIIDSMFTYNLSGNSDVVCGIGDDAAIVKAGSTNYAVSTDTLVEKVHFNENIKPYRLGSRAVRVAISDLAAMGAAPKFALLAITIPEANKKWLTEFSAGLKSALSLYKCDLIGGDTTKGPLTITLQVIGEVYANKLLRDGAKVGDRVMVTGELGGARAALDFLDDDTNERTDGETIFLERYYYPNPRIEFGKAISSFAHAAIDISDGLIADLSHIAKKSHVKIKVFADCVPVLATMYEYFPAHVAREYALTGGDDYELAFTVPKENVPRILEIAKNLNISVTDVGLIENGRDVECYESGNGQLMNLRDEGGFDHFKKIN